MQIDRESLVQRYEDLIDAELLRRLRSGELTELAHEVAMAELQARGLSLEPEPAAAVAAPVQDASGLPSDEDYAAQAAAAPAEVELAADRFDINPYQAPRAAQIQRQAERRKLALRDVLWWGYIGVLVLFWLSSFVLNPRRLLEPSSWLGAMPLAGMITGLVAWRLRRRLLHPLLWVALLAVFLAQSVFALRLYFTAITQAATGFSAGLLPVLLFMVLLVLPGLWGLAHYSFLSSAIWRR